MKSIYVVADEYYERTNRGQRNFIGTGNKDGKEHGLETWWHENGQKHWERTYKDGKVHGRYTGWHENGQKKMEITFKDGTRKDWDEDGNPR